MSRSGETGVERSVTGTGNPASACIAGMEAQEAGKMAEAMAHFERALRMAPGLLDVRLLLAYALGADGQAARARRLLTEAEGVGTMPMADLRRLADAAVQTGATEVALGAVRRLLESTPDDASLHSTLGALLQESGAMAEANHVLHRAVLRWPTHVPSLINNAQVLLAAGGYAAALRCYDSAVRLAPRHDSARWHRGLLRLMMGDYAGGWSDHEARRSLPVHTVNLPAQLPAWNGRNAAGRTLLLWGEQGYGDQIQGVRFAAHLAALGARVVVRCAAPLRHLFQSVAGVSQVVGTGDHLPACDFHVPMLSVPFLLHLHEESAFGHEPYLRLPAHDPQDARYRRSRAGSGTDAGPQVGVVWAGSPGHSNDRMRSMSAEHVATLLQGVSARWVSLQTGERGHDLHSLPTATRARVADAAPTLTDFVDTAHVLGALDRMVTVDTAVAHLAGALGIPTLLLLPFVPDWRWQLAREDSPWYGSIRVLRQSGAGDWTTLIALVHRELSAGGQAHAA